MISNGLHSPVDLGLLAFVLLLCWFLWVLADLLLFLDSLEAMLSVLLAGSLRNCIFSVVPGPAKRFFLTNKNVFFD